MNPLTSINSQRQLSKPAEEESLVIQKFSPEKEPEKAADTGKTMLLNMSSAFKGEPTEKDSEDKKPG